AASVSAATARLESARLWAARVEPITRHFQTTWATLRRSPPSGLDLGGTILPDDQIDLVGLYVARGIPARAYALVTPASPAAPPPAGGGGGRPVGAGARRPHPPPLPDHMGHAAPIAPLGPRPRRHHPARRSDRPRRPVRRARHPGRGLRAGHRRVARRLLVR